MIDKLLSKCGLVRKSQHNRIVTRASRKGFSDGVRWNRAVNQEWATAMNKRIASFRLEATKALRQRDALQEALDRANRRLEDEGLMPVVTFI